MDHGLYRLLRKLGLQRRLNWNAAVSSQDGREIVVPLLGELGSEALGELHKRSWKLDFFQRLRPIAGDVPFVDVGANVGQTLLQHLRAGTLPSSYLAFEPNPVCAGYLHRLAEANGLTTVEIFPFALSAREECSALELARSDDASASMVPNLRMGRTINLHRRIACFRLDYLLEHGFVGLSPGMVMKIDVEGAEADVIEGARAAIGALRPIIQCEVLWSHSPETLGLMKDRNARLMAALHSAGYRVFRLRLDVGQRHLLGADELGDLPGGLYSRQGNSHQCDYLFAPAERAAEIQSALSSSGASGASR